MLDLSECRIVDVVDQDDTLVGYARAEFMKLDALRAMPDEWELPPGRSEVIERYLSQR